MTLINNNSEIDTILEMLIIIAFTFFALVILCRIGNMLESMPATSKPAKKKKEVVKEVKKETSKTVIKEKHEESVKVENNSSEKITVDKGLDIQSSNCSGCATNQMLTCDKFTCPYSSGLMQNYNPTGADFSNNYLYDRFSSTPTSADCVDENKISEVFLNEDEVENALNRNVNIRVNDVENINLNSNKSKLYNRISQMTSENMETKERLLKEFEGLSREMKLILIDNIIQKM